MLRMIDQHKLTGRGADRLACSRPWPAYAVALVVATLDDATRGSVIPDDVAGILGMQSSTAERHMRELARAGFLARDPDGGWVPVWEGTP